MIEWPFENNLDILAALKENKPLNKTEINVSSPEIQKLAQWYTSVPCYTFFRVNTVNTNVQQVTEVIKNQLLQKSSDYGVNNIPDVIQDTFLKDCVVISSWNVKEDLHLTSDKQYEEVIVDVQCGVAIMRGANVFAPGVMGMTPDVKEGDIVSVYADLSNKCLRGFLKPYKDRHKRFLGYGVAKMTRKLLFETSNPPGGIAVEMKETISGVPSFTCPPEFGLLQNYPSILCSHILDPQEDDLILDMCASPGNKTTHIASLLNGKSHIIALDKTVNKIERIKKNYKNQRLRNITAFVCNAIKAVNKGINTERDVFEGPPFNKNTFDRILLDAPCSALGQRPQLRHSVPVEHLNSYPNLQKRLFKAAVDLLKPSGVLVYSTCTLVAQENEGIVSWALSEFPELHLLPAEPKIGSPGNSNCGLSFEQCHLVQKFSPYQIRSPLPYQSDTVGFFIAKFTKDQNR